MENGLEKKNNLVAFIQAYLLSLGGINEAMGVLLGKSDGIMIMNLIPIAGLIALHFITSNKKTDLNMDKRALLFVYYIVSVIIIYKYAYRKTTLEYEEVLTYILVPIYLSFYKVDVEKLLKYMTFFSALILPFSGGIFKIGGYYYETIGMSTTYNILPFVVAAILHFWYYRKNAGFLMRIGYAINLFYLFMAISYGNRGPIVALMALCVLIWLHKFDKNGKMKEYRTRTIVIFVFVGIGVTLLIYNFEGILLAVNNWLNSMGIEIAALSKSIRKLNEGNLSNGRDYIFAFTIDGIKENYLLGNGIASMFHKSFYEIAYPHNLFLQMWYDLGVFVSIPLLWITVKTIIKCIFRTALSKQYAVVLMLLFTISIPRLCYSFEFWCDIPFWFLLMYSISPNLYEEKTKENNFEEMSLENEKKYL